MSDSPWSSLRRRRKERRLEREKLQLADLRHRLRKWGFSFTPSEEHEARRRIERQEARVLRLEQELGDGK